MADSQSIYPLTIRKSAQLEDAVRAVCYGFWMLREYHAELAPQRAELTFEEWNNHVCRTGWLVDHIERDVVALADLVWGEGVGAARLDLPWGAAEAEGEAEPEPAAA
jgi:hypothetical protein